MPYKDPAAARASMKRWYAKNAEKHKAKAKTWRANNPEKKRAYDRQYERDNLKRLSAQKLAWNRRSPERHRAANRRWAKANPAAARESGRRNDFWRSADARRVSYVVGWRARNPIKILEYRIRAQTRAPGISDADWARIVELAETSDGGNR